ncbi:MAG: DNA primase [Oscillospiraceae bacterium]|nr:DNA primase [Oscillospiraceae bacterium]
MAFPSSFIEELIERNDITDVVSSYVSLSRKGGNLFGLCPFHSEKTPSFSVSPEKQIYHCFGCGVGGGVINFIMSIENLSYPDAVHFLANRAGMTVPDDRADDELPRLRRRMLELNKEAARWFYANLSGDKGAKAVRYLEKRKILPKTAKNFGLGAAPGEWDALINAMREKGFERDELVRAGLAVQGKGGRIYDKFRDRLMFPVIDVRGEVLGFSGRTLEDDAEPKYLNSPETLVFSKRRTLYGINLAKNTKRDHFILVEGNVDVVSLHQAGVDSAVASMGTALTTEQTRLISRYVKKIVLCYDNDAAGIKATDRALDILRNSEFSVKVLRLPNGIVDGKPVKQDADDFIKKYGGEEFDKLISGSGGSTEYRLTSLQAEYDLTKDEQRVAFLKKAGQLLAALSSPVEREIYAAKAAEAAGISAEAMEREVERAVKNRRRNEKKEYEKQSGQPSKLLQPRDKALRYKDVRSALAEEGVIRQIMLDPSTAAFCDLEESDFSSPVLWRIYSELIRRCENKQSLSPGAVSSSLEGQDAEVLASLAEKPETAGGRQAVEQYINVIKTQRLLESTDLAEISKKMREIKSNGG